MSDIKKNILAALAYFDLFNYPLTIDEVYLYLPAKCDAEEFDYGLRSLVIDRLIYKFDKFYTLKNDYFLINRRVEGNTKAAALIGTAKKVSDLLIRFPYVRGIAISGSLSKNFADEDSDIDLFVITAKNRLWIARTLMHCLKKLTFLVNKQHYFCMNYYIDEQELQIHEKNIYTAIEIATLMPLHGDNVFEHFYNANAWTRNYLPNKCMRLTTAKRVKNSLLKRFVEFIFNNRIGNMIDNLLMKITAKRWLKKEQQKKRNTHGVVLGMDVDKHYAKPDPKNFQNKLIVKYTTKVTMLLEHSENSLAH
ncbi:MAG TPA: nucleotidyltransferase domain-containing protein [Mucilaginibacter sp.]|nr:nucleotidyltransferase domain-containing protein [Mucilaginibacter sp.]